MGRGRYGQSIVGSRSSGGSRHATDVWMLEWQEEAGDTVYTKSTKVYSEGSMKRKVEQLKYALKTPESDPNDDRWRWRRAVLSYTVYHQPLNWKVVETSG